MDETADVLRAINTTLAALTPTGGGTVTDVSVVTANGVSGSVATSTTTPAITLSLGAITPSSVAIGAGSAITSSGAGGALGTAAFTAATAYDAAGAAAAVTPTSLGLVIGTNTQAHSAALDSWASVTRATGFDSFSATPTSANLRSLLTDENGTGAALFDGATSATLTTPKIAKIVAPSDSTTAVQVTKADGTTPVGIWDTTNKGMILGGASGGTAIFNSWPGSYSPAFLEINTGATGTASTNFASLLLTTNQPTTSDGPVGSVYFSNSALGTTEKRIATYSAVTEGATNSGAIIFNTSNAGTLGERMRLTHTGGLAIGTTTDPGAGNLTVSGGTIKVRGTTSSAGQVVNDAVNGFTLQSAAGTSTWNDASTAGSGTVANRYLFGIAAPTLTATNASTVNTVASTFYIGGAPTASGLTIGTAYALNVAAGNTLLGGNVGVGIAPTAHLTLPAGTTAAGTAPLKFTTQASPLTTVEQGTMELVGNSLQFTQKAKRRGVAMTDSTLTADTTWAALANGTTESGAVITAPHGAGYLEAGKMEEIVLVGTIAQRSNANAILTMRVKYAGSTILTFATPNSTAIAANSALLVRVYTTCRTTGAAGSMQINAVMEINGTAIDPQAASLASIDTTTAQDTTITFQWGSDNDAGNTVTIHQGRVLCIEPNR